MSEKRHSPNMHTDSKTNFGIVKTKKKLKNYPLKSKNLKKALNHKISEKLTPKYAHYEYKKSLGGPKGSCQMAEGHLEVDEGHQPSTGARRRPT